MNYTPPNTVKLFDVQTGLKGVIGLHCFLCDTLIIINLRACTEEYIYCDDCAELAQLSADSPIPFSVTPTGKEARL